MHQLFRSVGWPAETSTRSPRLPPVKLAPPNSLHHRWSLGPIEDRLPLVRRRGLGRGPLPGPYRRRAFVMATCATLPSPSAAGSRSSGRDAILSSTRRSPRAARQRPRRCHGRRRHHHGSPRSRTGTTYRRQAVLRSAGARAGGPDRICSFTGSLHEGVPGG